MKIWQFSKFSTVAAEHFGLLPGSFRTVFCDWKPSFMVIGMIKFLLVNFGFDIVFALFGY